MHPWTLDTDKFIKKARAIHGLRYGYADVDYVNAHAAVEITCAEHGTFRQKPYAHLSGKGCRHCTGLAALTTNSFISSATAVHGERYDYSQVQYVNNKTKVRIECGLHGCFDQIPNSHLSGRGCPECAKGGYKNSGKGYVYLLLSECGQYVKVGITNKPKQRFSELRTATPFMFVVIDVYPMRGQLAPLVEKWAHQNGVVAGLSGFGGATEWLRADLDFEFLLHCVATQAGAA